MQIRESAEHPAMAQKMEKKTTVRNREKAKMENSARYQISSGQGPLECQLAVGRFVSALLKELPEAKLISSRKSSAPGATSECLVSAVIEAPADAAAPQGSILWICRSPFRPHHGRKNWFIDIRRIRESQGPDCDVSDLGDVRMETFRCGGNGGQNVNKVETGVRLIHEATGITVTATNQRTQELNRKEAASRLRQALENARQEAESQIRNDARMQHHRLERGGAVRVYEGPDFRRRS